MQNRPVYETEPDLRKEREVIEVVARVGRMTVQKLADKSQIDFALMKGDVVWGVAEVKVRNRLYPQMMLSLHKVQALRLHAAMGLQARVIFAVPEGIYAKRIEEGPVDGWIGYGGRTDRGDAQDREPVVFFGELKVNGRVMREERQPMTRLADSDPRWFKEME